jgi:hypothetical protein
MSRGGLEPVPAKRKLREAANPSNPSVDFQKIYKSLIPIRNEKGCFIGNGFKTYQWIVCPCHLGDTDGLFVTVLDKLVSLREHKRDPRIDLVVCHVPAGLAMKSLMLAVEVPKTGYLVGNYPDLSDVMKCNPRFNHVVLSSASGVNLHNADTAPGVSGSPLLDGMGRVFGMHMGATDNHGDYLVFSQVVRGFLGGLTDPKP